MNIFVSVARKSEFPSIYVGSKMVATDRSLFLIKELHSKAVFPPVVVSVRDVMNMSEEEIISFASKMAKGRVDFPVLPSLKPKNVIKMKFTEKVVRVGEIADEASGSGNILIQGKGKYYLATATDGKRLWQAEIPHPMEEIKFGFPARYIKVLWDTFYGSDIEVAMDDETVKFSGSGLFEEYTAYLPREDVFPNYKLIVDEIHLEKGYAVNRFDLLNALKKLRKSPEVILSLQENGIEIKAEGYYAMIPTNKISAPQLKMDKAFFLCMPIRNDDDKEGDYRFSVKYLYHYFRYEDGDSVVLGIEGKHRPLAALKEV